MTIAEFKVTVADLKGNFKAARAVLMMASLILIAFLIWYVQEPWWVKALIYAAWWGRGYLSFYAGKQIGAITMSEAFIAAEEAKR
jgi:hypothetical protein